MKKVDFESTLFSSAINDNIKGFISIDVVDILKKNSVQETILNGMEYRPDKVSEYFYGNPNMSWMIDLANGFINGMKEYRKGRTILVPKYDVAQSLLSKYVER